MISERRSDICAKCYHSGPLGGPADVAGELNPYTVNRRYGRNVYRQPLLQRIYLSRIRTITNGG